MQSHRDSPRLGVLQAYRAVAALGVVLLHIGGKFSAEHYYGAGAPNWFTSGKIGVDFFFVLSGFIIAGSIARGRQPPVDFLLNRALRIYPPFWLAFFFTLPVALLLSTRLHTPVTTDLPSLVMGALLLPQWTNPLVIGVAWTLQHEMLFYLLAGLFLAWPRSILAVALLILMSPIFRVAGWAADFLGSQLHWEFVMGVVAALLCRHIPFRAAPWLVALSAFALLCLMFAFQGQLNSGVEAVRVWAFGPAFGVLIAASARWELSSAPPPRRIWQGASLSGWARPATPFTCGMSRW